MKDKEKIMGALFLTACLTGCGEPRIPKELTENISAYERLVFMVQRDYKKGEIIGKNEMGSEIKALSDQLEVNSINYDTIETVIRLCGPGNMLTGDSCFTYNYGKFDLSIENDKNSGCERVKLQGKWYKDYIYFD